MTSTRTAPCKRSIVELSQVQSTLTPRKDVGFIVLLLLLLLLLPLQ
jgi:hypothetical protein